MLCVGPSGKTEAARTQLENEKAFERGLETGALSLNVQVSFQVRRQAS